MKFDGALEQMIAIAVKPVKEDKQTVDGLSVSFEEDLKILSNPGAKEKDK